MARIFMPGSLPLLCQIAGRRVLPFGRPSLSQPSLSHPPPRPDGRERAPEPIFERISPSSPVRSGGRMREEGWGDEGQRIEDAKSDQVEVGSRYNRAGHVLAGNLTPAGTVE